MLSPHRDAYITYDTQGLFSSHLTMSGAHTIDLNYYEQNWPESLSKQNLQDIHENLASLFWLPAGIADVTPKEGARTTCI